MITPSKNKVFESFPDHIRSNRVSIKSGAGFTLVEIILYVSIASVMLTLISIFIAATLESRVKSQTIAEVEQGGAQAIDIITQTIRNSVSINSPTTSTTGGALSLGVIDPLKNPTIFDLNAGSLRITEGAGSPVEITNPKISTTGLTFSNLSKINTPGSIRIEFTVSHINPSGRNEFGFSKNYTASASLR
ncbi:MAG: hypothetical protein AAB594_01630 [Patescibacteria group bacterium]